MRSMNLTLLVVALLCGLQPASAKDIGIYQHGTVVRMHMADCASSHRGFMATMSGPSVQMVAQKCPEYTLVSDKVVFVIVGRSSNQLIPLADAIDFRFHNGELAVRVDDVKHESKFAIKEMILRSEWDLVRKHIADQLDATSQHADGVLTMRN
jgi:hypothetical protein